MTDREFRELVKEMRDAQEAQRPRDYTPVDDHAAWLERRVDRELGQIPAGTRQFADCA